MFYNADWSGIITYWIQQRRKECQTNTNVKEQTDAFEENKRLRRELAEKEFSSCFFCNLYCFKIWFKQKMEWMINWKSIPRAKDRTVCKQKFRMDSWITNWTFVLSFTFTIPPSQLSYKSPSLKSTKMQGNNGIIRENVI